MSVANLECQIAQAQIARHLAGESLMPEVLADLEAHIESCASCAADLERRRAALQAMLGGSRAAAESVPRKAKARNRRSPDEPTVEPGSLVGDKPVPDASAFEIDPQDLEEFRRFMQQKRGSSTGRAAVETQPPKRRRRWAGIDFLRSVPGLPGDEGLEPPRKPGLFVKPLLYSLALTGILIAMSTVLRDPTTLFGERAIANPALSGTASGESAPGVAEPQPASETDPASVTDLAEATSLAAVGPALDAVTATATTSEPAVPSAPTPEAPDSSATTSTPPEPSRAPTATPTVPPAAEAARASRPTAPAEARAAPATSKSKPRNRIAPRRGTGTMQVYDDQGRPIPAP